MKPELICALLGAIDKIVADKFRSGQVADSFNGGDDRLVADE